MFVVTLRKHPGDLAAVLAHRAVSQVATVLRAAACIRIKGIRWVAFHPSLRGGHSTHEPVHCLAGSMFREGTQSHEVGRDEFGAAKQPVAMICHDPKVKGLATGRTRDPLAQCQWPSA